MHVSKPHYSQHLFPVPWPFVKLKDPLVENDTKVAVHSLNNVN